PIANSAGVNSAYEFRNKMSSDPACQEIASQADRTYSDQTLDSDQKKQALEQLRSRAQTAGCL
ncbi:MAG TPA: hypothetical protein VN066_04820, partial [Rhodocyclaceae bacterium]|nr:hypothetical protein [Rhodocyclaceae bacterium]